MVVDNVQDLEALKDLIPNNRGAVLMTAQKPLLQDPMACHPITALTTDQSIELIKEMLKSSGNLKREALAYHDAQLRRVIRSGDPTVLETFVNGGLVRNLPLVITSFCQLLSPRLWPLRELGRVLANFRLEVEKGYWKGAKAELEKIHGKFKHGETELLLKLHGELLTLLQSGSEPSDPGVENVRQVLLTSLTAAEEELMSYAISVFEATAATNLNELPVDKKYLQGPLGLVKLWLRQLESQDSMSPAAMVTCTRILACIALLHEEAVPRSLIAEVVRHWDGDSSADGADEEEIDLEAAISALCSTPLLQAAEDEEQHLVMHGLFQLAVQQVSPDDCRCASRSMLHAMATKLDGSKLEWDQAVEVLDWLPGIIKWNGNLTSREAELFPGEQEALKLAGVRVSGGRMLAEYRSDWESSGAMLKASLLQREEILGHRHADVAEVASQLGFWQKLQGRYVEAEQLHRRALEIREEKLGPDHHDTAASLNDLAEVLHARGQYGEAEQLHRRALEIREEKLGPDHPETAASLNNLAGVLRAQGRYGEAEQLHRRALRIDEEKLGPDHPSTATSLGNLAGVLMAQGRYGEAEQLHRRALRIKEEKLGPDHPTTAASLSNLAGVLRAQGRYDEAEQLYRRALRIEEEKLGPDHPSTAISLGSLAGVLQDQGRYDEAEQLHRRALEIHEEKLGPDHPTTATSLGNLAVVLMAQGRTGEAEQLHRRALEIEEEKLGPDHPDTAASLNNLAGVLEAQGRYVEAEQLYRRALRIVEEKLGPDHPSTATSLGNLAVVLRAQGRTGEAEQLYSRALRINEEKLGPDHPTTATSLGNLAGVLRAQERYGEAEQLHRRALRINEEKLGPDHPTTATSLGNLAGVLRDQGQYGEAEQLHRRALEIEEEKLGPDHPSTATSLSNLAGVLSAQGRHGEAEQLYSRALRIYEEKLGPDHPTTATSLSNLASLYQVQQKFIQAEDSFMSAYAIQLRAAPHKCSRTLAELRKCTRAINGTMEGSKCPCRSKKPFRKCHKQRCAQAKTSRQGQGNS